MKDVQNFYRAISYLKNNLKLNLSNYFIFSVHNISKKKKNLQLQFQFIGLLNETFKQFSLLEKFHETMNKAIWPFNLLCVI